MEKEEFVPINDFCENHNLEMSFIYSMQQYGLVETIRIEETIYLPLSQLAWAERIARLYGELGINMEGIDAIGHLLQRVESMQQEITMLRNKLSLYE
ncbi:MAG TPA: chaperone modulator CbpM [Chitinophagaceae bacterium]|nr:chaperone modulator CbpM [Chitinophagaceae bacterium]